MNHDMEMILSTVVIAIFLGILAQVLAYRLRLPAILPLLLFGMAAGPYGVQLFDPSTLGHGLEVIIHLGVAIILFEGGLVLDPHQLRQVSASIRNLLTIGTGVTGAGAAWLAHALTGVSWSTAALFGAIVTVTGPTVISPLLRHMITPRRVRTILLSEGLMIDPIGAVLAYFVLQWIVRAGPEFKPFAAELFVLVGTGVVLGYVAGAAAIFVVKYRHMNDELRNLVILALLMACFLVSEHQAPQSGILASVVMGLTVSAARIADLNPLKVFKSQLTILVISVLFVLLSAQLDLGAMYRLGTRGLLVVAGLILLVRPLSVLLSIPPSKLDWKEKTVLGLNAPRGIVAAAVASLSAIQLRATGSADDATTLEGLVYLVILITCTWSTIMATVLPRLLGYLDDPSRRRAILVGAGPLSAAMAKVFHAVDWTAVVVDSASRKLAPLREQKVWTVRGDAREASTYEAAEIERDAYVLALTNNDELNLLVAELVRDEFGIEHPVVAQQQPSKELGTLRRAWVDLLSGRSIDLPKWSRKLEDGRARVATLELDVAPQDLATFRTMLQEQPENLVILCGWQGERPDFSTAPEELEGGQRVTLLATKERLAELKEFLESAPPAMSEQTGPEMPDSGAPASELVTDVPP